MFLSYRRNRRNASNQVLEEQIMAGSLRYTDASNFHDTMPKGATVTATREQINQYLEEMDETVLLMDGFDEAFIGFSQRINEPMLSVYSWQKMVDVLMERDGMDYDEATEYISFNCIGTWIGEKTPIIVMPLEW